jgi:FixJ family two-component response regulator
LPQASLIAIVDDDESMRESVAGLIRSLGYAATSFASAEAFLGSPRLTEADCLISDVKMKGMSGLDLLAHLRGLRPALPVILISAFIDPEMHRRAMAGQVFRLLGKPFDEVVMVECLRSALER